MRRAGYSAVGSANSVGGLTYDECISNGGDPQTCQAAESGSPHDKGVAGGKIAGAAGCAAAGFPEFSPLCGFVAGEIGGAIVDFFSGPAECGDGASGWICDQQSPEQAAAYLTPNGINVVNALFNAWIASTPPEIAPYMIVPNMAFGDGVGDGVAFADMQLSSNPPSGSLRRAWLSKWYQAYYEKNGKDYEPNVKTVGDAIKGAPAGSLGAMLGAALASGGQVAPVGPLCPPGQAWNDDANNGDGGCQPGAPATTANIDALKAACASDGGKKWNPATLRCDSPPPSGSSLWLWGGGAAAALAFVFRKQLFSSKKSKRR